MDSKAMSGASGFNREYVEMMHHRAMHQVNNVLNMCINAPRSAAQWNCLRQDKHLELFAKKNNSSRSVCFLGVNELRCGFDEVYNLLNYDDSASFRLTMKLLYGRNFRDGAVMSTQAPREYDVDYDVADVQHSAVWMNMQERRDSLRGKHNLLSFFQALMVLHPDRSTTASSGMSLWAKPSDSVKKTTLALAWLPFHQRENNTHDTKRSLYGDQLDGGIQVQYTLVVEEVSRRRLRVSCLATSFRDGDDLRSHSNTAARHIARRLVARSISKLEGAVLAARLSRQTLVTQHQWVRNEDRAACVICWKAFHALLRRRHHCRLCGEVICGTCSTLRDTNVLRNQKFEKIRVCHLCSNVGTHRRSMESLVSASHGSTEPSLHLQLPPPQPIQIQPQLMGPMPTTVSKSTDDDTEDSDAYGSNSTETTSGGGYSGGTELPPCGGGGYASQKLISIRSMSGSTAFVGSESSTSSKKVLVQYSSTVSSYHRQSPREALARAAHPKRGKRCDIPSALSTSDQESSPCLRESLSFLHPAAEIDHLDQQLAPKSIVADIGSYDGTPFFVLPLSAEIMTLSRSSTTESRMQARARSAAMRKGSYEDGSPDMRRTSIMSIGQLCGDDASETNESRSSMAPVPIDGAFHPRLDASHEKRRLKLMRVICSPACTLVDRSLMQHCCTLAMSAFRVPAAFIARVEKYDVVMEHVTGCPSFLLSSGDVFRRSDMLCDFVLVSPTDQPFCVHDCRINPSTSDNAMVRDLNVGFFIGINIRVRGLPIACLCVFNYTEPVDATAALYEPLRDSQHVDLSVSLDRSNDDDDAMVTQQELGALQKAARSIEHELDNLIRGINLP